MDILIRKLAVKLAQLSERYENKAINAFGNVCAEGMVKAVENVKPLNEISAKYIRAAYAPQLNTSMNSKVVPRASQA